MSLIARDVRFAYPAPRAARWRAVPVSSSPWLLDGVDLAVEAGTSVAVVGPSGSGKTTFLSVLGGLLDATSGGVELHGAPVSEGSALLAGAIAWVPQGGNVLGARSVLDNVALRGIALGASRRDAECEARQRLRQALVPGFDDRRADSLSGGERQRVCIARAMMGRPDVLLADEPTGNLDRRATAGVVAALLGATAQGTAVVVVTHDVTVAERCARRVELRDGRLREQW